MEQQLKLTDNSKVKFRKNHYNTFGLMYGPPDTGGTCPGATAGPGGCMALKREGGINATCYVAKLTKVYPAFGKVLLDNTMLLQGKTQAEMETVIRATVQEFVRLNKKHTDKLFFRIHTSGDFFSADYARAWATVINEFPAVRFWVYTRSMWAVPILIDCRNLALYLSADPVNIAVASETYTKYAGTAMNLGISFMGDDTSSSALQTMGRWVPCPQISGKVKNTIDYGACARCRLCFTFSEKIKLRNIQFPVH